VTAPGGAHSGCCTNRPGTERRGIKNHLNIQGSPPDRAGLLLSRTACWGAAGLWRRIKLTTEAPRHRAGSSSHQGPFHRRLQALPTACWGPFPPGGVFISAPLLFRPICVD
jgi:hypothetical protein